MGKIWKEIGQILQKLLELPLKLKRGLLMGGVNFFMHFS